MFRNSLTHTDNVSKFVDTFHKFIKSSHSQSITTTSHAVTQSQHIYQYIYNYLPTKSYTLHTIKYDTTDYNTNKL